MGETAGDPSVEMRVGRELGDRGETLATAESCTGGLIASLVTDVPGASDYFDRGVVTYSYDSKRSLLAVDREALDGEGAVSEPVARAMATGIRDIADTTWGIATTGIAGPTGGTRDRPVGTAFIGCAFAGPWGSESSYSRVERHRFEGDRREIKARIARAALHILLEEVRDDDRGDGRAG